MSKGETFRILYNKRKYDIGVVEVRPEGGSFGPGQPQAVCIIETDINLDFEAPADYVEPTAPPPAASAPATSPLEKSPICAPLARHTLRTASRARTPPQAAPRVSAAAPRAARSEAAAAARARRRLVRRGRQAQAVHRLGL